MPSIALSGQSLDRSVASWMKTPAAAKHTPEIESRKELCHEQAGSRTTRRKHMEQGKQIHRMD
jgi:hypothetical protein